MVESKSTTGACTADISRSATASPGATVVYSFAQGVAALKAGKQIRYEGPGGPTSFDAYHDSTGIFQVDPYTPTARSRSTGTSRRASARCGP